MPNIRLMLWGVLAAILFLNYQTWLHDYETPVAAPAAQTNAAGTRQRRQRLPAPWRDALPQGSVRGADGRAVRSQCRAVRRRARTRGRRPAASASQAPTTPLHVSTDVLDIVINLKGGELDQADLKEYPLRKDTPNIPVRLFSYEPPPTLYLLQSGLIGSAGETAPTHLAVWKSDQKSFALAPGAD